MPEHLAAWLLLISLVAGIGAARAAWKRAQARDWPEADAKVVSNPESVSERWFRHLLSRSNTDSDYCLEWTVEGVAYRRRLDNKSEVSAGGFVLWSKGPDTTPQKIRFNPRRPSKSFIPCERNEWILLTAVSAATLVAGLVVNAV